MGTMLNKYGHSFINCLLNSIFCSDVGHRIKSAEPNTNPISGVLLIPR